MDPVSWNRQPWVKKKLAKRKRQMNPISPPFVKWAPATWKKKGGVQQMDPFLQNGRPMHQKQKNKKGKNPEMDPVSWNRHPACQETPLSLFRNSVHHGGEMFIFYTCSVNGELIIMLILNYSVSINHLRIIQGAIGTWQWHCQDCQLRMCRKKWCKASFHCFMCSSLLPVVWWDQHPVYQLRVKNRRERRNGWGWGV